MEKHFFNSNHSDIISEIISFLDINDEQENIVKFVYPDNGYEFTKKIVLYWKKNSNCIEIKNRQHSLYFRNKKLHRDNDLPAVILNNGTAKWYKNGKFHRENDKPAIIYSMSGLKEWFQNGKYYRENNKPTISYNYE